MCTYALDRFFPSIYDLPRAHFELKRSSTIATRIKDGLVFQLADIMDTNCLTVCRKMCTISIEINVPVSTIAALFAYPALSTLIMIDIVGKSLFKQVKGRVTTVLHCTVSHPSEFRRRSR